MGQSEHEQRRRLSEGCCPQHGLFMQQTEPYGFTKDGVEVGQDEGAYTVARCPRRDCGIIATTRGPFSERFVVPDVRYRLVSFEAFVSGLDADERDEYAHALVEFQRVWAAHADFPREMRAHYWWLAFHSFNDRRIGMPRTKRAAASAERALCRFIERVVNRAQRTQRAQANSASCHLSRNPAS